MAGSFTIGDFKASGNPEPRKRVEKVEKVEKGAEKKAASEGASASDELKTPRETYQLRLKEAAIEEDLANAVFDDVITRGYYQEESFIRGRKLVLRTRTYDDHTRTIGAVEYNSPKFQATQEEIQARYNLAASLVEWNGVVFKKGGDADAEFQATLEAIRKFPTPLYSLMIGALVKFDARMYVIFSDGAAESF